jgi:hypothetical protein
MYHQITVPVIPQLQIQPTADEKYLGKTCILVICVDILSYHYSLNSDDNYLHTIYKVLSIVSDLEPISSIQKDGRR